MTQILTNVQHMAQFDREIIKKYLQFPLSFDGISYIFDAKNDMIAQRFPSCTREMFQDFVNCVNDTFYDTYLENFCDNDVQNLFQYDEKHGEICYNFVPIIDIRGWGWIQYVPYAENIYINMGKFLTFCCNYKKLNVNLLD